MDVFNLSNSAISTVYDNTIVSIYRSIGFTIGGGQKQIPLYDAAVDYYAQLQYAEQSELEHIDGLNIQGLYKKLLVGSTISGSVRPRIAGGDLVVINNEKWLVVTIEEAWVGWSKAIIVLQNDN